MRDQFKNYDRWKLRGPEEDQNDAEDKARRDEDRMERANEERDRAKGVRRMDFDDQNYPTEGDLS